MKIYTYYQDINHSSQNELIHLWKISWSRQGYEPIVLDLEDAKKHPYFETMNSEMRRIFAEITGRQITEYGMSCWFRWLAYAMQKEDSFYVSDYDAINANFKLTQPHNKLHLMDADCPFLASGTPKQFSNLCKAFVDISNNRIKALQEQANHYHDQEFFQYNFMPQNNPDHKSLKDRYDILFTRSRKEIGGFYDPILKKCIAGPVLGMVDFEEYKVFHIAHHNTELMMQKYPELKKKHSEVSLRVQMIKDILNID